MHVSERLEISYGQGGRTGDVAHLVVVEDGLPAVIADHVFWVDLSATWSTALQRKLGTCLVRLADYTTMSALVNWCRKADC
jgi:hypothetical protein